MTKPTISEFNCELGEIVVRELSKKEIDQIAIDKANAKTELVEAEAKAQAKAALLDRLGITEDEAKLLLS
jgi:ABC-type amino acid transport substrate-binding protein